MAKLVVTTGTRFTDIDGLACVIGYREIPPEPPLPVIAGELNQSVTTKIRNWSLNYLITVPKGEEYDFVVVDVSEASQLAGFVNKDRIIELYDHHFGFEKYWQEKLGEKAKIEPVGACATLIWEEFKKRNPGKKLSPLAANLLYTAIVSNTLNFQASVTTERDKQAFEELKTFIDLPTDWIARYYQDQEMDIYTNPERAIANDTKIQTIKSMRCAVGQLELWNSETFIKDHLNQIESAMKGFEPEIWFFTSPSISEGRNYIFTRSETVKNLLRQVLAIDFFGTDIGVTKKLWLRKEILKKIQ
jgi:inorganic pyrophosphatase/manganese-dependent inorganic pyrophosphatase